MKDKFGARAVTGGSNPPAIPGEEERMNVQIRYCGE